MNISMKTHLIIKIKFLILLF